MGPEEAYEALKLIQRVVRDGRRLENILELNCVRKCRVDLEQAVWV